MKYASQILSILFFMFSFFHSNAQEIQTVAHVDLEKYAGKWFEIASFPQRFSKGCTCSTANYTLTKKGFVMVENRCNRDTINGKESYVKGKAFVVPNSENSKLKVQFFWPFKGKYWIIELASDYSYAVVGHPNFNFLWILSRTPKMEESTYQQIISRVKLKGFDITKIRLTTQK